VTTNAYAAKRAIIDRLKLDTGPGQRLDGVSVGYAYSWDMTDQCIYCGGHTFTVTDDAVDGKDVLNLETVTVWLYIRVFLPGGTVEDSDNRCEQLGAVVGEILGDHPDIGGFDYTQITAGRGDYDVTDDGPISILAYQLNVSSHL
jgi:hypothetical protein